MIKKFFMALGMVALGLFAVACSQADTASQNLKVAADNFEINRRIVYFAVVPMKGTEYLLSVEGRCSLGNQDRAGEMTVTCKEGPGKYKKHFFSLPTSTPVGWFVEQGDVASASAFHSRIVFRPTSIIPNIEFKGGSE